VEKAGVTLEAILNTHHHWDHTGGNLEVVEHFGDLAVYGHASDKGRIPGQTVFLEDGDTLKVGNHTATIRHVPGHTTGAIAFCFEHDVFTGDTLFYGGCGRLFEGTPAMMFHSLNVRLKELEPSTRFWHGHEYTVSNLQYGLHAEPDNAHIKERLAWAIEQREKNLPTVPSTLADEVLVNPFMRAQNVEELARLRAEKDTF
jgi:hydroxyacylglutathione hydrolase